MFELNSDIEIMSSSSSAAAAAAVSPCSIKQHLLNSSASPTNSSISSSSSSQSSPQTTNIQFQLPQFHLIQQQLHQQGGFNSLFINSSSSSSSSSLNNNIIKKEPGLMSPAASVSVSSANVSNVAGIGNENFVNNNLMNKLNGNSPQSTTTPTTMPGINNNNSHCNNNNSNNNNNYNNNNNELNSKCKRKINFSHLGIPNRGHQPATVARRNARERNRVKQVNNGFSALKQHIPLGHRSKKMSKVETLRCAVEYIKNLKTLLDPASLFPDDDGPSSSSFGNQNNLHQLFDFGLNGGGGSSSSTQQLSPTSSDVDTSSPSYASEGSFVTANSHCNGNNTTTNNNNNNNNNALYDYENYEPVSPEDEELLDAISWWQQS